MTLDEIEKTARQVLDVDWHPRSPVPGLAHAVLMLLPVVRAADAGVDGDGTLDELVAAVDRFRRELRGKV